MLVEFWVNPHFYFTPWVSSLSGIQDRGRLVESHLSHKTAKDGASRLPQLWPVDEELPGE
jgi:hypothetical protein